MVRGGCLFCSFCTWLCRLLVAKCGLRSLHGVCCLYWLLFPAMFSTPSLITPTSSLYFSLWSGVCSFSLFSLTVRSFVEQTPEVVNLMWGQPLWG